MSELTESRDSLSRTIVTNHDQEDFTPLSKEKNILESNKYTVKDEESSSHQTGKTAGPCIDDQSYSSDNSESLHAKECVEVENVQRSSIPTSAFLKNEDIPTTNFCSSESQAGGFKSYMSINDADQHLTANFSQGDRRDTLEEKVANSTPPSQMDTFPSGSFQQEIAHDCQKIVLHRVFQKWKQHTQKRIEENPINSTNNEGSVKNNFNINQFKIKRDKQVVSFNIHHRTSSHSNPSKLLETSGCGKRMSKPRACSSIRRIQEKLQGDLQAVPKLDRVNTTPRRTKPLPAQSMQSERSSTRRQRSRSRASRYSSLVQRPYRRWLGVSTNIFSDSRYIVNSRKKLNAAAAAALKRDPSSSRPAKSIVSDDTPLPVDSEGISLSDDEKQSNAMLRSEKCQGRTRLNNSPSRRASEDQHIPSTSADKTPSLTCSHVVTPLSPTQYENHEQLVENSATESNCSDELEMRDCGCSEKESNCSISIETSQHAKTSNEPSLPADKDEWVEHRQVETENKRSYYYDTERNGMWNTGNERKSTYYDVKRDDIEQAHITNEHSRERQRFEYEYIDDESTEELLNDTEGDELMHALIVQLQENAPERWMFEHEHNEEAFSSEAKDHTAIIDAIEITFERSQNDTVQDETENEKVGSVCRERYEYTVDAIEGSHQVQCRAHGDTEELDEGVIKVDANDHTVDAIKIPDDKGQDETEIEEERPKFREGYEYGQEEDVIECSHNTQRHEDNRQAVELNTSSAEIEIKRKESTENELHRKSNQKEQEIAFAIESASHLEGYENSCSESVLGTFSNVEDEQNEHIEIVVCSNKQDRGKCSLTIDNSIEAFNSDGIMDYVEVGKDGESEPRAILIDHHPSVADASEQMDEENFVNPDGRSSDLDNEGKQLGPCEEERAPDANRPDDTNPNSPLSAQETKMSSAQRVEKVVSKTKKKGSRKRGHRKCRRQNTDSHSQRGVGMAGLLPYHAMKRTSKRADDSFHQDGGLAGNVVSVPHYEFEDPPPVQKRRTKENADDVQFDGTNGPNPLRQELKQYAELGLHPTNTKNDPNVSAIRRFMNIKRTEKKEEYYCVQAIEPFVGKLPGQLSFEKGQIIKQLDTGLTPKNGMSYGYYRSGRLRRKKAGLYPCTYVTCQVKEND